jgi:phospholipase/carboxylesterase
MNTNNKNFSLPSQASLEYLVRKPKTVTENPPLLLLMHGVGSNEQDLFSLAQHLPDNFLIISARGPYTIGTNSFAWFQVSFSTGVPVIDYTQAENSRKTIIQFIESLKTQFQFNEKKIYVGGFSQGGIMSYSVGLTRPDLIKGIAVMSGRLLKEIKPQIASPEELKNLQVYISHGTSDNVLSIEYAREANAFLKTLNITPTYEEFEGGHTVTNEMLLSLIDWLKSE